MQRCISSAGTPTGSGVLITKVVVGVCDPGRPREAGYTGVGRIGNPSYVLIVLMKSQRGIKSQARIAAPGVARDAVVSECLRKSIVRCSFHSPDVFASPSSMATHLQLWNRAGAVRPYRIREDSLY
jgi:hypothetical protein